MCLISLQITNKLTYLKSKVYTVLYVAIASAQLDFHPIKKHN